MNPETSKFEQLIEVESKYKEAEERLKQIARRLGERLGLSSNTLSDIISEMVRPRYTKPAAPVIVGEE